MMTDQEKRGGTICYRSKCNQVLLHGKGSVASSMIVARHHASGSRGGSGNFQVLWPKVGVVWVWPRCATIVHIQISDQILPKTSDRHSPLFTNILTNVHHYLRSTPNVHHYLRSYGRQLYLRLTYEETKAWQSRIICHTYQLKMEKSKKWSSHGRTSRTVRVAPGKLRIADAACITDTTHMTMVSNRYRQTVMRGVVQHGRYNVI